jgi:16S rRNA (guanine1207-N2)-methyltransferase
MSTFSFDQLSRHPDVEAANLFAVDASDRLILDEAAAAVRRAAAGSVVVVGDHYGALTLGAVGLLGAEQVRVYQDPLTAELALAENAARTGLTGAYRQLPLGPELFSGAQVVLVQAPASLAALQEIAEGIAACSAPAVEVFVGARIKHMTPAMNDVLGLHFGEVHATRARQKSRVLIAAAPRRPAGGSDFPLRQHHEDLDLIVCAFGGVFGGTKLDLGTRHLVAELAQMEPRARIAVDLGCGTGIVASLLARTRPELQVIATDQSAAAVASTQATAIANGLAERISVTRDDAMSTIGDASVDLVVCNPPFHLGNSVHAGAALKLFEAAGRVLRPGGELWTVFNTHLGYRASLERLVGPTKTVRQDDKFTVAVSRPRRSEPVQQDGLTKALT